MDYQLVGIWATMPFIYFLENVYIYKEYSRQSWKRISLKIQDDLRDVNNNILIQLFQEKYELELEKLENLI